MGCTGLRRDDPPKLRRQKKVAFYMNVTCCVVAAIELMLILLRKTRITQPHFYWFRVSNHIIWLLMLFIPQMWYFIWKSHKPMKYVMFVLGPYVTVDIWFAFGCNMYSASADAFLPSFMIIPLLFCVGSRRREIFVYSFISSLLAIGLYIFQFVQVQRCAWLVLPLQIYSASNAIKQ